MFRSLGIPFPAAAAAHEIPFQFRRQSEDSRVVFELCYAASGSNFDHYS